MVPKTRVVSWLVRPLRWLPGNVWGRFWWWYWDREGVSREEQRRLIDEASAGDEGPSDSN